MIFTIENTYRDLETAGVDTAIIPFCAVEQHGFHLPLGTDFLIAQHYGEMLAEVACPQFLYQLE